MLQLLGRCGGYAGGRAHIVEIGLVRLHLGFEHVNLLVQTVDVALMEVVSLQFLVGLVGSARGVVDEQLYHHAACVAVDGGRAVGK